MSTKSRPPRRLPKYAARGIAVLCLTSTVLAVRDAEFFTGVFFFLTAILFWFGSTYVAAPFNLGVPADESTPRRKFRGPAMRGVSVSCPLNIKYLDYEGNLTIRDVHVILFDRAGARFHARDLNTGAVKTFRLDGLIEAIDPSSRDILSPADLPLHFRAHRAS